MHVSLRAIESRFVASFLPVLEDQTSFNPRVTASSWRLAPESKRHLLVVDDAPDIAQLLATFLRAIGYEVLTANSANEALELASDTHFDAVISDIGMPVMNGYEFAAALRAITDYRNVPLVAVTGFDEYDDGQRSRSAGFDAHLKKPLDLTQLASTVGSLLR